MAKLVCGAVSASSRATVPSANETKRLPDPSVTMERQACAKLLLQTRSPLLLYCPSIPLAPARYTLLCPSRLSVHCAAGVTSRSHKSVPTPHLRSHCALHEGLLIGSKHLPT